MPRVGLRARLLISMVLLVTLLGAGLSFAVYEFVNTLEAELLQQRVVQELDEFARDYRANPQLVPLQLPDLTGYIVLPGEATPLPPAVLGLGPGLYKDVLLHGRYYFIGRRDVGAVRLYLLLDIGPVSDLENLLIALACGVMLIALLAAGAIAVALSKLIIRPVTQLADTVGRLDPRQRGVRLHHNHGEHEVGVIAAAFDRYLEGLDAFVEREQAFTEDASHELRTPLAVILSAAELLEGDSTLSSQTRQRVLRIGRAARQMQGLLEALLFLAREDGGVIASPCSLDEVLRDVIESQRETAQRKSLTLTAPELVPQVVSAPAGMVAAVFNNLIANAIHHTDHGHVEVTLTTGLLRVRDTGAGIAAPELAHIFERRYRGVRSRGLGLGLYIVQRICQRLGWRIAIHSRPGEGTEVQLRFA